MERPKKKRHGLWIALFNLSGRRRSVSLSAEEADLPFFRGSELWTGRPIRKSGTLRAVLPSHDAAVFLLR